MLQNVPQFWLLAIRMNRDWRVTKRAEGTERPRELINSGQAIRIFRETDFHELVNRAARSAPRSDALTPMRTPLARVGRVF